MHRVQLAKALSQGFDDSSWTLQTKTSRSYHDLEHYNSVRLKEETCNGPRFTLFNYEKKHEDILLDLPRITNEEQIKVMISSPRWSYHDLEHYNSVRLKEETCNRPRFTLFNYEKKHEDILLDLPRITNEEQIKVMVSQLCTIEYNIQSYHDLEHYNSVRLKEETCNGPTRPIIIKPNADFSVKSNQANVVGKTFIHLDSIKTVKIGNGCENEDTIQQVLLQVNGDVDAAIDFIIADEGTEENSDENDRVTFSMDTSHGNDRMF
ncbi:hypothetical protein L2E82_11413 [Cichorium intybus]|uniref:Uncharacterized protein n=1 Tax=Cichorium intybus TaxID=13427 RepID=A0ACB9GD95_CICIN|nr:hypothetical protein L2E82_11413 [Cichorium intybus]